MAILCPNRGDHIVIADGLRLSVLETNDHGATFGVCDASHRQVGAALSELIAAACHSRRCYFWFPEGGCCTMVVKCGKGKSLSLAGSARVTVLDVSSERVTLAIAGLPDESSDSSVRIRTRRSSLSIKSDGNMGQPVAVPAA